MGHLPKDERERLNSERSNTNELIMSRLRTLNQRLDRKDELLKDYEKDLEKLRLAERLANEKAVQVEALAVSDIATLLCDHFPWYSPCFPPRHSKFQPVHPVTQ